MTKQELQVIINKKNIKKLIKRINELEDWMETKGKPKTLRPIYHSDIGEDNGFAMA